MDALSKYQQTAKRIIDALNSDNFKLDMFSYTDESECGTTFCLAGWLAHKDDYPEDYLSGTGAFNYGAYAADLVGRGRYYESLFLFSSYWPNDKEAAIKRCEYVLKHDDCPDEEFWSDYE